VVESQAVLHRNHLLAMKPDVADRIGCLLVTVAETRLCS
jgi:hypothetical protein